MSCESMLCSGTLFSSGASARYKEASRTLNGPLATRCSTRLDWALLPSIHCLQYNTVTSGRTIFTNPAGCSYILRLHLQTSSALSGISMPP